ncbi:MAG: cysteine desulfurase NifS [Deltaproteobacteria bacterium]|nr:cysteine desulfurase NifS [Deltaproteobacteria bacterium]
MLNFSYIGQFTRGNLSLLLSTKGSDTSKTIYLDNNATTRVAPEVLDAMLPYFRDHYGNPSSAYGLGGRIKEKIDEARHSVSELLGAHPREILFTSGGTESDNTAIRSALEAYPEKRHIVTSQVEHPAIRSLCQPLAKKGYRVTEVPVDENGRLDFDFYERSLTPDTAIVSLMWANNETGVLFPVEKAAEKAREKGILFHTDAVQAVGKIGINLSDTAIDMLSLSGHKLHGPKGVGALFVRKGISFKPLLIGGHQERGRRAGTENAPGIIGLGKAAELARAHIIEKNSRVRDLRDKLESAIVNSIPETHIHGYTEERLPNTTNIGFEYVEGEAILLLLDELGICASTGSACTSGSLEPSHVLLAMGISHASAQGAVRFSLSPDNTENEIDFVSENIPGIIDRLREMSPLWKGNRVAVAGGG